MDTDTTAAALVKRRHISKTTAHFFSFEGVRRVLAEDQRIRRRAKRFGLKARHHRVIGGLSLLCKATGGTVVERSIVWQIDEFLEAVQRNPTEQKLLACQINVLKLKKAIQEFAEAEDRAHARLWGDAA